MDSKMEKNKMNNNKPIPVLYENKVDAVLIGETLMRSPDKKEALAVLSQEI